jgi:hypothetical protein
VSARVPLALAGPVRVHSPEQHAPATSSPGASSYRIPVLLTRREPPGLLSLAVEVLAIRHFEPMNKAAGAVRNRFRRRLRR